MAEGSPGSEDEGQLGMEIGSGGGGKADRLEVPGGGDEPRIWSVSQVSRALRKLLEGAIPEVWVSGEVANWTRSRAGHCYFTLKDETAQLKCVLFRREAQALPTDPEEGDRLRVRGRITLYEQRGDLQLVAQEVAEESGEGLWRLAFEKLKRRLEAEGLLAEERKRPIPAFARRIGLVTSPTGAAIRDVLTVLRRRAPWVQVVLAPSRVQGEGAAEEVAAAIRRIGAVGGVELLLVVRGGGSIEDLWSFNEEVVARAIVESPIPVISGVGHETDITIADLVADRRAATPSAAAEAAATDRTSILEALRTVRARLGRGLNAQLERRRAGLREWRLRAERALRGFLSPARLRIERGLGRLERAWTARLRPLEREVERSSERIRRVMLDRLKAGRRELEGLAGRVHDLSPLAVLGRGFAVPTDEEGRLIRSVHAMEPESDFNLRVLDGRVSARVRSIEEVPVPRRDVGDAQGQRDISEE